MLNPKKLLIFFSLLTAGLVMAHSTPSAAQIGKRYCLGTQFGHKTDRWSGKVFACYFKNTIRRMDSTVVGVAHRTLPCGTMVKVCNMRGKRKCTIAPVVDRGPYWAVPRVCMPRSIPPFSCWRRGKPIVRNIRFLPKTHKWKFANCIDMMPPVRWKINHPGLGAVTIQVVPGRDYRWTNRPRWKKKKYWREKYRRR